MAQQQASAASILNQIKKRDKSGAWNKNRGEAPKVRGSRLPGNLINARGVFSGWKLGTSEKGVPFLSLTLVTVDPPDYKGVRATDTIRFDENDRHTVEEQIIKAISNVQLIGGDTDGKSIDDLPKILDALQKEKDKPEILFNTSEWEFDGRKGVSVFFQGIAEDKIGGDDGSQEVVENNDEQTEEVVEEGDELDEMDRKQLQLMLKGLNPDFKFMKSQTEEDLKAEIRALQGGEEEVVEEEEEVVEETDEAGDGGEGDGSEAGVDEWEPAKDDVYGYKPKGARAVENYTVKTVNKGAKTVTLIRDKDQKEFKAVPWDALSDAI